MRSTRPTVNHHARTRVLKVLRANASDNVTDEKLLQIADEVIDTLVKDTVAGTSRLYTLNDMNRAYETGAELNREGAV